MVNVIDLDGDLITALGDLTDRYGVAGVRKAMGILWPLEPVKLAAGGFVNGPNPVLVGEKDGPFLPQDEPHDRLAASPLEACAPPPHAARSTP
jgi:hypothetical protein